jgi:hypothetical protein
LHSIDTLLAEEGRQAFHQDLTGLIRSERHDEADAILTRLIGELGGAVGATCEAIPADSVMLEGWDAFNARIEELSSAAKPLTAVGIDITDQGDAVDAKGRREQQLESSYYDDSSGFDFAAAGRTGILAEASGGRAARWVGSFADLDGSLTAEGLAPLYDLLLQQPERGWALAKTEAERRANVAAFLAGWFRHLRVHQAVRRALQSSGLARDLPVIVGTNEVSPYFTAVYYAARLRDDREAAAKARDSRLAASRAEYAQHTEEQVAQWRQQREGIRGWNPRVNPDKRQQFIRFAEACDNAFRKGTPIEGFDFSYKLSDAEFERMIQVWRHHRDPNAAQPPPPPAAGASTFRRIIGFGKRRR